MSNVLKTIIHNYAFMAAVWIMSLAAIKAESKIDSVVKPIVYSIGYTPTAVFNTATGFQINQRLAFKERAVIGFESAYIFDFIINNASNIHGVRLRPFFNFLIPLDPKMSFCIGGFVNYRKINFDIITTEIKAGGNYTEKSVDKGVNRFVGGGIFTGARYLIDDFEINAGLGIGWGQYQTIITDPNGVVRDNFFDGFFVNAEDFYSVPVIFLNLGVNYRFM